MPLALEGIEKGWDPSPMEYVPLNGDRHPSEGILTESELDAIVSAEHFRCAAVGLLGKDVQGGMVKAFQSLEVSKVLMGFDAEGEKVASSRDRAASALVGAGFEAQSLTWDPSAKGLGDAIRASLSVSRSDSPPPTLSSAPRPLPDDSLPAFPVDEFFAEVPALCEAVKSIAARRQVDPGIVAMLAFQLLALPLARARGRVDWDSFENEALCLQGLILAPSGYGKTPPYNRLLEPFLEDQDRMRAQHKEQGYAIDAKRDVLEAKLDSARRPKSARADDAEPDDEQARINLIAEIKRELDSLPPSRPPSWLEGPDKTPESYPDIIRANNGYLAIGADEAKTIFDRAGGQYSATKTADSTPFIAGWDGKQSWQVDRKGKTSETGPFFLSLVLLMQTDFFPQINKAFFSQGVTSRFLYWSAGRVDISARSPKVDEAAGYDKLAAQMMRLAVGDVRPSFNSSGDDAMEELQQRLIDLRKGASNEFIKWLAKARNNALRIAAILAVVEAVAAGENYPQQATIGAGTVRRTAALMEALACHARAVIDGGGGCDDPVVAIAKTILEEWAKWPNEMNPRTIRNANKSKFSNTEAIESALALLEDYGWVSSRPTGRTTYYRRTDASRGTTEATPCRTLEPYFATVSDELKQVSKSSLCKIEEVSSNENERGESENYLLDSKNDPSNSCSLASLSSQSLTNKDFELRQDVAPGLPQVPQLASAEVAGLNQPFF